MALSKRIAKSRAGAFFWRFVDATFPVAEPLSVDSKHKREKERERRQKEWEAQVAALPSEAPADEAAMHEYFAACKDALDAEQQRQQSVEARLTTIVGLFSIASTVVFGAILTAMPSANGLPRVSQWLLAGMFLSLAYIVLQLISAILAGVRGSERRNYASYPDLLPNPLESSMDYCRRQIKQFSSVLEDTREQNNEKVTQMAVAHRAMKNFIWGILFFAIFASLYRISGPSAASELVNQFKTDRALFKDLRGPQGERGKTGPRGLPGIAPATNAPTTAAQVRAAEKNRGVRTGSP